MFYSLTMQVRMNLNKGIIFENSEKIIVKSLHYTSHSLQNNRKLIVKIIVNEPPITLAKNHTVNIIAAKKKFCTN